MLLTTVRNLYERSRYASEKGAYKLLSGVEIPDEWGSYLTQQTQGFEIVHRPLWDTNTITTTQSANLNWFTTVRATLDLGNEVFPLKNSFLIAGIGIYFKDQATQVTATGGSPSPVNLVGVFNDHILAVNTGILFITIGTKDYGPWPMWKLHPGAGVWGVLAAAGSPGNTQINSPQYSQMGMPSQRDMFKLAIPLVLPMQTRVVMQSGWPAGALSLSTSLSACLILDGKEARPLQ